MYRSCPHEMVSKARFVGVMRNILGLNAVDTLEREKIRRMLSKHLDSLHYCFESNMSKIPNITNAESNLFLNWRHLICVLRYLQQLLDILFELLWIMYFWKAVSRARAFGAQSPSLELYALQLGWLLWQFTQESDFPTRLIYYFQPAFPWNGMFPCH
jgi:hypothetical protein